MLIPTGISTNGLWCVNSKLLATLLLWSYWSTVSLEILLLIESSFEHWSCYLVQIPGYTLLSLLSWACFPRAYIIISLIRQMKFPCSHNCGNQSFGNLDDLLLSLSATSSSSPSFTHELLFQNPLPLFISRESYDVFSSICVAPFLLRHPESEVSWHQLDLNLGQIWWLEHISKSYNLGLMWPGQVMSCLAHLAGWPYCYRFLFSKVIHSSMGKW